MCEWREEDGNMMEREGGGGRLGGGGVLFHRGDGDILFVLLPIFFVFLFPFFGFSFFSLSVIY